MADEEINNQEKKDYNKDLHSEDTEERDVYKDEYRDHLTEDDEISPEEEGFMKGYEEDSEEN
ncbi:MAG: hypothetical protein ACQESF_01570 [Nanobdellota archaeon]